MVKFIAPEFSNWCLFDCRSVNHKSNLKVRANQRSRCKRSGPKLIHVPYPFQPFSESFTVNLCRLTPKIDYFRKIQDILYIIYNNLGRYFENIRIIFADQMKTYGKLREISTFYLCNRPCIPTNSWLRNFVLFLGKRIQYIIIYANKNLFSWKIFSISSFSEGNSEIAFIFSSTIPI